MLFAADNYWLTVDLVCRYGITLSHVFAKAHILCGVWTFWWQTISTVVCMQLGSIQESFSYLGLLLMSILGVEYSFKYLSEYLFLKALHHKLHIIYCSRQRSSCPPSQRAGTPGKHRQRNRKSISLILSLIHIWRCRRSYACRSRWSPYH